jgi:proline racemase
VPKQLRVSVTEYHTTGQPFRIVTDGIGPILGQTILEKRRFAQERLDHVRRLVINEPRGRADMYGCFVTEPATEGAVRDALLPQWLVRSAGQDAVLTEVTGSAQLTGIHQFILEPDDPLGNGFLMR